MSKQLGVSLTIIAGLLPMGCQTTGSGSSKVVRDPWTQGYRAPKQLDTALVHLEPLSPRHAEMDFEAAMSSRAYLRKTLHWGDWPSDDMTVDKNRGDLSRHMFEFDKNEAYAFTVLTPDRSKCVGCVYVNPAKKLSLSSPAAKMALWVVEDQLSNDLDRHLLESMLMWFRRDWNFKAVALPIHRDNERLVRIAEETGLLETPSSDPDKQLFIWKR